MTAEVPLAELLVAGRAVQRSRLKGRLVAAGLKENRCESCGIDAWQGRVLALQLHHLNGVADDNRLENLALLCPNCHSQTPTHSRKRHGRGPRA